MKPDSTKTNTPPRLRLRVTAMAEKILRGGHPWIFSESVRKQNRDGLPGELAVIFDRNDKFLAVGFYDPDSPIRVRVLHCGKPVTIDAAFWAKRLSQAVARRENLFDESTTGYRVINGESDSWPGLVLDRYDTTLVLKLYTAAWLARLEETVGLIRAQLSPERIVLRLSRNIQHFAATQFTKSDGELLFGPPLIGSVIFSESGLRFEAEVLRGQKTGFFLDQRENRKLVGELAQGRSVLNAFSFSGGFSLYAARGEASSATDLDISAHALAGAERNFSLNRSDASVAAARHETIQADSFEWLEQNARRKFDLIILDPPSFARREVERPNAVAAYERLSALGIELLSRDGILVSCSCSAHVSAEEFFEAARRAAKKSGRKFSEMRTPRHAPDHPAMFKEAEYLKAIFLGFS